MATSAIPTVKAALVERLQADSDLDGVQVSYGLPYPRATDKDWVWLGDADETQVSYQMGRRRRLENWTQTIVVSILRAVRNDVQEMTERAFEIAGVIETSLREWSEQSGNYFDGNAIHVLVSSMNLDERVSEEARESRVTMTLNCQQII